MTPNIIEARRRYIVTTLYNLRQPQPLGAKRMQKLYK